MQLLYQTHSPYARKVLVMAHETGLAARLHVMHQETSPTHRNDLVFALNPLGKVPVLVLDDGQTLFDSAVISDYLDALHDGPRLIPDGPERWRTLRLQALAQGMADAGIVLRWETERRPAHTRWPPMAEGQAGKLLAPTTCWSARRRSMVRWTWARSPWRRRSTGWNFGTCPTSVKAARVWRRGSRPSPGDRR